MKRSSYLNEKKCHTNIVTPASFKAYLLVKESLTLIQCLMSDDEYE